MKIRSSSGQDEGKEGKNSSMGVRVKFDRSGNWQRAAMIKGVRHAVVLVKGITRDISTRTVQFLCVANHAALSILSAFG